MGEWSGELIALLSYGAYLLLRRALRNREAPGKPAPEAPPPEARSPRPAPPPPEVRRQPEVRPPPVPLPEPWRDLERRAADVAALPDLESIAEAAHRAGRIFFRTAPGLEPELRARMGLPRTAPLPSAAEGMTVRQLAWPLGPWLPVLFADAFATLALGPAYVIGMRRRLAPSGPQRALTILADDTGTAYGAMPPSHLRVLLCCDLLAELGHTAEASRQLSLWHGELGAVDVFAIPTSDREWMEVPIDPLHGFGERAQDVIASEPLAALGGVNLTQLRGLRFTRHDQSAAEGAALALARGETVRVAPRVALAAALIAADESPGHEVAIQSALRRSLMPAEVRERAAPERPRRAAIRPVAPRPRPGRFIELSPAVLREAVIARAVLWR